MTVDLINNVAGFLWDPFGDEELNKILELLEDSDSHEKTRVVQERIS